MTQEHKLVIRALGLEDVDRFMALRREALERAPSAFMSSPEDDRARERGASEVILSPGGRQAVFGAFAPELVGLVGVMREEKRKGAHKAFIWGMYVSEAARGLGAGGGLLEAAIGQARSWEGVRQLQLGVSETAEAAQRLYARHGFVRWGTEPEGLFDGERFVAEHHMALALV